MPLNKAKFDLIHTGKGDPRRYLIVGFDTEYQRYADDISRTLNNEVLSYQYCCTVIEKGVPDINQPVWSGLIKATGPAVEDRISLEEFLLSALTDGSRKFPNLKLPSTIYLVAHFTRADVPGFSDFKDQEKRSALQLENIRNLFMNVATDIRMELASNLPNESIQLSVKIRDTTSLVPGTKKSLAAIGDILGFEKIEIGSNPKEELLIKQNMKKFMEQNWNAFSEYAIIDAEICTQ